MDMHDAYCAKLRAKLIEAGIVKVGAAPAVPGRPYMSRETVQAYRARLIDKGFIIPSPFRAAPGAAAPITIGPKILH